MMTRQLVRFTLVGGLAAAVHLAVLWILVNPLLLKPLVANVVAFAIAFVVSYSGQSLWTFNHKQHGHKKSLVRFLAVQLLCSFTLNQGLYSFFLTYSSLHYMAASLIVLLIVPLVTFTLSKYWAFQ